MSNGRPVLLILALGSCMAWTSARADVAPYPRPTPPCRAESEKGPGEECVDCKIGFDNPERCEKLLKDYGFDQRCRGRGTVRNEAWCRTAKDAKPVPQPIKAILGNPKAKAPEKVPEKAPEKPAPAPAAPATPAPTPAPPPPPAPIAPEGAPAGK